MIEPPRRKQAKAGLYRAYSTYETFHDLLFVRSTTRRATFRSLGPKVREASGLQS